MHRSLTHWLFIVSLLVSQTVFAVHAADVDAHADGEHCSVCMLSSVQDGADLGTAGLSLPAAAVQTHPATCWQLPVAPPHPTYQARAPPHRHTPIR